MTGYFGRSTFCVAAILASTLSSMIPRQAVAAPAWNIGTPIVTYWEGPGSLFSGQEVYGVLDNAAAQQVVGGGFNVACAATIQEVQLARWHGLRTMFQSDLFTSASLDGGTKQSQLNALIDQYKILPAAYSYHIADEPGAAQFSDLGRIVSYIRQRDPSHMAYINLFPNYASNSQLGTNSYDTYLSQYNSIVQPSLLSYDHYQFRTTSDGSGYLQNLASVAQTAKQAGVPFLNTVQACSYDLSAVRVPTADETRFLVYSTLAYGAQGISYYHYRSWGPDYGGIVLPDGAPLPIFSTLQTLNNEFVKIAQQTQPLNWIGTYLKGYSTTRQWPWSPWKYNGPPGTATLPSGSPFTISNISEISYSNGDPLKGVLFGFFDKDGTALSDATLALIENLDYTASKDYTVTGPGNLFVFDATTGRWIPKGSSQVVLHLNPGGGFLVGLTSEVPEPSAFFILLSGIFGLSAYAWHKRECVPS